jgi:hypothetical protein
MKWQWFLWQVVAPLAGPVVMSAIVVLLWSTGQPQFPINWTLVVGEMTPWALTFYCITLIGASMYNLLPTIAQRPALGGGLMFAAIAVSLYAGMIVIWRHDPTFNASVRVYAVTGGLLIFSVYLCHKV